MSNTYSSIDSLLRDYNSLEPDNKYKVDQYIRNLTRVQRAENNVSAQILKLERKTYQHKTATTVSKEMKCNFCGKTKSEAHRMILGPQNVIICDECIGICNDILADSNGEVDAK